MGYTHTHTYSHAHTHACTHTSRPHTHPPCRHTHTHISPTYSHTHTDIQSSLPKFSHSFTIASPQHFLSKQLTDSQTALMMLQVLHQTPQASIRSPRPPSAPDGEARPSEWGSDGMRDIRSAGNYRDTMMTRGPPETSRAYGGSDVTVVRGEQAWGDGEAAWTSFGKHSFITTLITPGFN